MTFPSCLSNIIGVEASKRVGFVGSISEVAFHIGDTDVDQDGTLESVRLNDLCHQMTGYSEELTEVIICRRAISGRFLYAESRYGLAVDNVDVIQRIAG